MRIARSIFGGLVSFAFVAAGGTASMAQDQTGSPSLSAQPRESSPPPGIQVQPENDRTLEIAPQTGRSGAVEVIPSDKSYEPGKNSASIDRNHNQDETGEETGGQRRLPYLGISVQYTLKCYLGQEEHGLEIVDIDPNSPAWHSGLRGPKGMGPLGAASVAAGALVGPLELLIMPLMNRAGQLGTGGDLIVAVDDHRVRSQLDLEDELAKLKPGDTMYLTVIRPLPGGGHRTMKIAVKVGKPGEAVASAAYSSPSPSSSDPEQYPY
jgi:PDZ domain-containing protein